MMIKMSSEKKGKKNQRDLNVSQADYTLDQAKDYIV